eukprot:Rmarinus@m.19291
MVDGEKRNNGPEKKSVNVQVAVRCRPLTPKEQKGGSIVSFQDTTAILAKSDTLPEQRFTFDRCYAPDSKQEAIYRDLGTPTLDKAFEGYNGTIFAYGQTGSGKTHTMMGGTLGVEDQGLIPLLNNELFERISQAPDNKRYLVTVSFIELYNEVLHDLLNPSDRQLEIRQSAQQGLFVQGLAELVVHSRADVENLMAQGNRMKQVAATKMNDRSSRSHSVFTLKIEQSSINPQTGAASKSLHAKLNLVDLAGSERVGSMGSTGARFKEGTMINKSLSTLGNVINALAGGKSHVPYRESKLTRLLQESLGGNTMTVMIATISPSVSHYTETLGTLNYANRAKNIKNIATKNEDKNVALIRDLQEEIERLRKMIPESMPGPELMQELQVKTKKMEALEEESARLEEEMSKAWKEKEKLSALFAEERKRNLAKEGVFLSEMNSLKDEKERLVDKLLVLKEEKDEIHRQQLERREAMAKIRSQLALVDSLATDITDIEAEKILNDPDYYHKEEERVRRQVEEKKAELEKIRDPLGARFVEMDVDELVSMRSSLLDQKADASLARLRAKVDTTICGHEVSRLRQQVLSSSATGDEMLARSRVLTVELDSLKDEVDGHKRSLKYTDDDEQRRLAATSNLEKKMMELASKCDMLHYEKTLLLDGMRRLEGDVACTLEGLTGAAPRMADLLELLSGGQSPADRSPTPASGQGRDDHDDNDVSDLSYRVETLFRALQKEANKVASEKEHMAETVGKLTTMEQKRVAELNDLKAKLASMEQISRQMSFSIPGAPGADVQKMEELQNEVDQLRTGLVMEKGMGKKKSLLLQKENEKLRAQIRNARLHADWLEHSRCNLESKLTVSRAEVTAVVEREHSLRAQLAEALAKEEALDVERKRLEALVSTSKINVTSLRETLGFARDDVARLEAEHAASGDYTEKTAILQQLDEAKRRVEVLESELTRAHDAAERLQHELSSVTSDALQFQNDKQELKLQLVAVRDELSGLEEDKSDLLNEIQGCRQRMKALESEAEAMKAQATRLQEETTASESGLTRMASELSSAHGTIKRLKDVNAEYQEKMDALTQMLRNREMELLERVTLLETTLKEREAKEASPHPGIVLDFPSPYGDGASDSGSESSGSSEGESGPEIPGVSRRTPAGPRIKENESLSGESSTEHASGRNDDSTLREDRYRRRSKVLAQENVKLKAAVQDLRSNASDLTRAVEMNRVMRDVCVRIGQQFHESRSAVGRQAVVVRTRLNKLNALKQQYNTNISNYHTDIRRIEDNLRDLYADVQQEREVLRAVYLRAPG